MIDHIGIQCDDVEASLAFYVEVFAPLGVRQQMRYDTPEGPVIGLAGPDGFPHYWLAPREDADGAGRRPIHAAFTAPDRAAVDEVHRLAVAAGAEILHAPREWPEYHDAYYGTFVRDPDGNNVEAVCHRPPG